MCRGLERLGIDGICNILSLIIPEWYAFYKFTPITIYIQKLKSTCNISVLITFRDVVTLVAEGNQLEEYFSWLHNIFSFKLDSIDDARNKYYYLDLKEGLEDD